MSGLPKAGSSPADTEEFLPHSTVAHDVIRRPSRPAMAQHRVAQNKIMLETALRLGLRDIDDVKHYEDRLMEAKEKKESGRARHAIEREIHGIHSVKFDALPKVAGPAAPVGDGAGPKNGPLTASTLRGSNFRMTTLSEQGQRLSNGCIDHFETVKKNRPFREKIQRWLQKKMDDNAATCYPPIISLVTQKILYVRRHRGSLKDSGELKSRCSSFTVFGQDKEQLYSAVTTEVRTSCCCLCRAPKDPREISVFSGKSFVFSLRLHKWTGHMPEWCDIYMPKDERYASIQSQDQHHVTIKNNYDMFDALGRVTGVASPEDCSRSDWMHVTMYNKDGGAEMARIKRTSWETGEYFLDCPQEMQPDLKAILIGLILFLLVEDAGGYAGRGKNGR